MILFIAIGTLVTGLVHYYLWARLVSDLELPSALHRAGTGLVILLCVSVPLTFVLSRSSDGTLRRLLLFPSYTWMGVLFMLLVGILVLDGLKGGGALVQRFAAEAFPTDPDRRLTLARMAAAVVFLFAGGASAVGLESALGKVAVKNVRVRLRRLPRAAQGTRIVQLSDVHVGPTIGRAFVEGIVEQVNALDADVVVITGDLVDGSVRQLRDSVAPLAGLRSKYGTYFVTGNHEYYSGARSWCEHLTGLGIRVLRNERVSIGEGEASFDLAGVDDYHAARFGRGHGADLAKALAGRDETRELVLLAHQPREIFRAEKHDVGLQLSGHTHGGQLWPWNYLVRLQQPVVSGLESFGPTQIYVSNGTGYWGPPMRLGAPAEITCITLESEAV
jgi:uncharacterized protein